MDYSYYLQPEQEAYLDSLLYQSDEDLLLEIARDIAPRVVKYERRSIGMLASAPRTPSDTELRQEFPKPSIEEKHKPQLQPYLQQARERLRELRIYLHSYLCDAGTQRPQAWAMDAATGQVKDIVVGIAMVVLAEHNTEASLAIPVAILLMRNGLNKFCSINPLAEKELAPGNPRPEA